MKALEAKRAELIKQRDTLDIEIRAFEMAIAIARGDPDPSLAKVKRAPSVKAQLLDMLKRRGAMGLDAAVAVELAAKEGKVWERQTVSSLLSRFKSDNTITYDGVVYRLPEFTTNTIAPTPENVVRHPASKAAS